MKIAVTGGSGKAGRAVVRDLREHGHDVLNVDRVPPHEDAAPYLPADLTDYGQTLEALSGGHVLPGIEAVVHLAAIPAPDKATQDVVFRTNITSTHTVFSAAWRLGLKRIVWASSETTLGLPFDTPPEYAPIDEEHPLRPESSYALSKVLGEEMARQFNRWTGIPIVGLRLSNVMEREDYLRFPSYWDDPQLRKWNLWGYVDESHVAHACRRGLEADIAGAEAFVIAAGGHRHAAPEPRPHGRGLPTRPGSRRRRRPRHAARHRQGAPDARLRARLLLEGALLMDQIRLGRTGLHVSRVCLGMMSYGNDSDRPWVLDEAAAEPIVRRAVEGGITFFDTADVYSARRERGRHRPPAAEVHLARRGRRSRRRSTADDARARTAAGCRASTSCRRSTRRSRRLGMDYVDLYQIHRWDPHTPIEETMEALHDVVRAGKARYIGASSMYAWQFAKAQHVAERHGWTPFVSMQNHYNLVYREEEREMIPLCIDQGVGVIPWSPLARGLLAGNRTRDGERRTTRAETDAFGDSLYGHPSDFDVVDRVAEVAAERGVAAGAGRARVAAAQARRHGADRRRDEARPPRGRARRGGARADRRRDRAPRGAVRPPPGHRPWLRAAASAGSGPAGAGATSRTSPSATSTSTRSGARSRRRTTSG